MDEAKRSFPLGTLLGLFVGIVIGVVASSSGSLRPVDRDVASVRRRLTDDNEDTVATLCASAADASACEALLRRSAKLVDDGAAAHRRAFTQDGQKAGGEGLAGLTRWRARTLKTLENQCALKSIMDPDAPCAKPTRSSVINFGRFDVADTTFDALAKAYEAYFQKTQTFSTTRWLGVQLQQDPSDAFVIADLLWRLQPDLVIELGTSGGGSAAFFGHVMHEYNPDAKLLTFDPADGKLTGTPLLEWNHHHTRVVCGADCVHASRSRVWRETDVIHYVNAAPDSPEGLAVADAFAARATRVFVIEDSNHLLPVVSANVKAYARFVTPGQYLLVQDTRLGSPLQAVNAFLASPAGRCFEKDRRPEYYVITQHWEGYLYRKPGCDDARPGV